MKHRTVMALLWGTCLVWTFFFIVGIVAIYNWAFSEPDPPHVCPATSAEVEALQSRIARDDKLLQHIFQGQWDPDRAVKPEFVEDWYGTPIYRYHMVDGKPGDRIPYDLGEIIDRKIELIRRNRQ